MRTLEPDRQAYWLAYALALAAPLKILDWRISVLEEVTEAGNAAHVEIIYGRKIANISLAEDFDNFVPEEQRHMIVHELVHVHAQPVGSIFQRLTESRTEGWLQLVNTFHTEAVEHLVDVMASIIAPHLPLPPDISLKEARKRKARGEPATA